MMTTFFDRLKRLLNARGQGHARHEEDPEGCPDCRPITCREALERVHEYLDGELPEDAHRDVAHHFEVCRKCYPHLKLEERFREALRHSRERDKCPDHVRNQVLELLASEAEE